MPELAEVEYFRRQWNCGIGHKVLEVQLHQGKRVFRDSAAKGITTKVAGSSFIGSEAHGKQMLFHFSGGLWIGIHLGLTGKLRVEEASFKASKHDHLVLYQSTQALVFCDPRLFGAVRFHHGATAPEWWTKLPPPIDSKKFTVKSMSQFLQRHQKLPIKAALLLQAGFPGIGNWMADEILWRAKIRPQTLSGSIKDEAAGTLWKTIRLVCRSALKQIGQDFSGPPVGWLFQERWEKHGKCPHHRIPLKRQTIGGRTSVWCSKCQH